MRGAKRRGATRPDCYATDTAWLEATLPTYALRLKAEALPHPHPPGEGRSAPLKWPHP